jgi:hypothetical protein
LPRLLDHALGFLGVLVLVEIHHRHIRPFLGEKDGDGAADAGVAAGDDGGFAL